MRSPFSTVVSSQRLVSKKARTAWLTIDYIICLLERGQLLYAFIIPSHNFQISRPPQVACFLSTRTFGFLTQSFAKLSIHHTSACRVLVWTDSYVN